MKKLKYLILALMLIPSVVFAYTVQRGDTPYELWGSEWKTELAKYGIQDPRKLPIGLEVDLFDEMLGAVILPEDGYDTFITSPVGASDTEIFVNVIPTYVSSSIYTIYASDGRTVSEKMYCTGTATSPNRLTGCIRGLSEGPSSGVIDETAGTGVTHSRNARIAITDNINFSGKALSILGGNQETGANNFDIGTATSTDANKCLRFDKGDTNGQICIATSTGMLYWTVDGGTNTYNFTSSTISTLTAGDDISINAGAISVSSTATSSQALYIVKAKSDGKIDSSWGGSADSLATLDSNTLVVENPANATSTPTANSIPISGSDSSIHPGWLNGTTEGDLFFASSTSETGRIGIGAQNQALRSNGTIPYWGSLNKVHVTSTDYTIGASSSETTVYSTTVPGGTLGTNNALKLKLFVNTSGGGNAGQQLIIRLKYGGQLVASYTSGTGTAVDIDGFIDFVILADNSTSAQEAFIGANASVNSGAGYYSKVQASGTGSVDSTSDQTLLVTADWATVTGIGNPSWTTYSAILEVVN